jgi:S1-C subfamily serine protease
MTQTGFDGETTGFQIRYLIGPGEGREFEITLRPRATADVIGDVSVVVGNSNVNAGFRLVFENLLALLPTGTPTPTLTPTQTPTVVPSPTATPIGIPYQAVVKIASRYESGGNLRTYRTGSGTLITPDGLILTSAHLVAPGGNIEVDSVLVSLTERSDLPPVEEYLAEVAEIDEDLDVAVLRITSYQDGVPVIQGSLVLPYVNIGDSDQLQIGDPISVLGYPQIGGETITLTRGDVAGFTDEAAYGDRAFIKTTATFSDGASGGLVIDEEGMMVAIPTQIGYGRFTDMIDCRLLADTNFDGKVNQRDVCVPVGGFINALRPINLAWPLIEAAKSGN